MKNKSGQIDRPAPETELIKPHENNPVAEFFSSSNTPETDAVAERLDFKVDLDFARKLERERDEAREDSKKWKKLHDTKDELFKKGIAEVERERDEWAERWADLSRACLKDICAMERERDEAREKLEEEKMFHHRTHSELIQTQCRLMDVTQAIIDTLEENRHLADGDDCTLAKLKSVVQDWK